MQKLTQKYVLVHAIHDLPDGYEYSMQDWPLHVTLADVFSIEGTPSDLLAALRNALATQSPISTKVLDEAWFGSDSSVHVMLLDKTDTLQDLHETILSVLKKYHAKFNNPEYTREGFRPHSTVQKNEQLNLSDDIIFDSLTLIDMFPNEDPNFRKVLGTVYFSGS